MRGGGDVGADRGALGRARRGRPRPRGGDGRRASRPPPSTRPPSPGADLVVETVVEDLEVKRALLARIEPWCAAEAVLATNTSSLRIADIAAPLARPERLAGLHFLKPAHLTAVVEVVPGPETSPEVVDALRDLARPDGQDAARGARRRAGLHLEPDPVRRAARVPPHAGGRDRGRGRHRRRRVGRARPAVDGGGPARHGRPGRPPHLRPGRRPAPARTSRTPGRSRPSSCGAPRPARPSPGGRPPTPTRSPSSGPRPSHTGREIAARRRRLGRVIRLSAHLSTLFPDVPELERPTAARSLGFTAVETWWPPADDRDAWVAAVSAASVRAVLVNADGGDLAAGERGFCTVAERHDEVVASVRDAMELARACGGATVNLLAGRIDPAIPEEAQRAAALDAVRASADEAVRLGGRVVIEHLNAHDVVRPLLPTPAAAAAFVRDADHEGVRLLFDAYHAPPGGGRSDRRARGGRRRARARPVLRQPGTRRAGHRRDRPRARSSTAWTSWATTATWAWSSPRPARAWGGCRSWPPPSAGARSSASPPGGRGSRPRPPRTPPGPRGP